MKSGFILYLQQQLRKAKRIKAQYLHALKSKAND